MRPRLKEDPKEWTRFTAAMALLASALAVLFWRRQAISPATLTGILIFAGLAVLGCVFRPRWYRLFYRGGMTVSFYIGQFMGRVLLVIFFLGVLTPMALVLRLLGKDLLALKRHQPAIGYWRPAKMTTQFDRQF